MYIFNNFSYYTLEKFHNISLRSGNIIQYDFYRSKAGKLYFNKIGLTQLFNNLKRHDFVNNSYNTEYMINDMRLYKALVSNCVSRFQKSKRVKIRIENMINKYDDLKFITLTFKPEILENTTKKTRHEYIRRFLKENCYSYLANIDYGTQNEREHYHAIAVLNKPKELINYPYGFKNIKTINLNSLDITKISKYITKLKNHCLKVSTKNERLIYSKN